MENTIVCPQCKKTIAQSPIVDAAAKGEGDQKQSVICDCGERITYWQITAQLRDQKTMGWRFKNWVWRLSHSQSA